MLTLRQSRFGLDEFSKKPQNWTVPVTAQVVGAEPARAEIRGAELQKMTLPGCGAVVVNAGQAGYYRVQYSEALFNGIVSSFAKLSSLLDVTKIHIVGLNILEVTGIFYFR